MLNGTLVGRTDLTDALSIFRIRADGIPWPFVPGQYITVGAGSPGGIVERPYSVASSARRLGDGYELYVRLVRGGALTPRLFETAPGQRISVRRPKGRFTLLPDDDRRHLFVASGCGVAPFVSMLRTLEDDGSPRPVVLLHGVSYVRELAYRDLFEELARDPRWRLTYVPTVSRSGDPANRGWSGRSGRVEQVLGEVCGLMRLAPGDTVAYLCGNPEMIRNADALLRGRGLAPAAIRSERYWVADQAERPTS